MRGIVHILLASVFLGSLSFGARTDSAETKRKKRQFLETPVFKINRLRKMEEFTARQSRTPNSKKDKRKGRSRAKQMEKQMEKQRKLTSPAMNSTEAPKSAEPIPKENPVLSDPPRSPQSQPTCGFSSYLKNYCYHHLDDNRYMICAGRWNGRCITKTRK